MKVAASPRSFGSGLIFQISHFFTTFFSAQDDEMRRRVLEYMVFTKDEKPVNLLNLQNPFNL